MADIDVRACERYRYERLPRQRRLEQPESPGGTPTNLGAPCVNTRLKKCSSSGRFKVHCSV